MKSGISKKFVFTISVIILLFIIILSVTFHSILRSNLAVIRKTLVENSEKTLLELVRNSIDNLNRRKIRNTRDLSEGLIKCCKRNPVFLQAMIFSRTGDENYFKVVRIIPLNSKIPVGVAEGSLVREKKDINYIKKGLYGIAADPEIHTSQGSCWQSVYSPFKIRTRYYVIEFLVSSASTYNAIEDYTKEISRLKKIILTATIIMVAAVAITGLLFLQNFSLLIRNLSHSMKRAVSGELDINLNPNSDGDLSELAHSFNSLIGEIKEKEKIIHELENKDILGDIFKFGVGLLKEQKIDDAIAIFSSLILLKPEGFGSYFNLGIAHAKKRNYEISLTMLEKALEMNPGHELTRKYIDRVNDMRIRHEET